jgi:tetraacyldisaccharide 4'-kinase
VNPQTAYDILSGRRRGLGASLLRAALTVPALAYAAAMRVRRRLYRWGLLPRKRAGAPVICVGNLTTGGTGKTPMVAWVVSRLKEMKRRPAVLTRGYKAAAGMSDEAALLRRLCGVPVIVNADRAAGAAAAVAGKANVLVMDDGFQHRRLRRELDVVLVDATNPFGFGWALPRGLLREPVAALKDAGAVVITRSDSVPAERLSSLRERLGRLAPAASLHAAVHRPTKFADEQGRKFPPDYVAGKKVFAFCGVANPESFFSALEALGAELVARRSLDDHVRYTADLLEALRREADDAGAEVLATTQKDAVKIEGRSLGRPLWELWIEIDVVEGAEALIAKLRQAAGAGVADRAHPPVAGFK